MNTLQTGGVVPLRIINATGKKQQIRLFNENKIPEGVTVRHLFEGITYDDIKLALIRDNYLISKIRFSREKTFYRNPFVVKYSKKSPYGTISHVGREFKVKKSQHLKNIVEKECNLILDCFTSLTFDVDINTTDIYMYITIQS
jgi:hypothetical protein